MKREPIFRNNWNVKTLFVLIAGLMIFGVLAYILYNIYKDVTRTRQVQNVVNVETAAAVEAQWEFGRFERIGATDYVIAPIHSKQSYQTSYYEKDASAVRNYLFVNNVDKSGRWLVPTNQYLFLGAEKLQRQPTRQGAESAERTTGHDEEIKWMKYEIIKSDTNRDGRITADDRRTIAVSNAAGEGYTEVIQDVEKVLGSMMRDGDTLLVFHSADGISFVTEINLPARQVTISRELPQIQPE